VFHAVRRDEEIPPLAAVRAVGSETQRLLVAART